MTGRAFPTVLLMALLWLLVGGCTGGQVRTNVILISLDTTRADHLGCYGSESVRTPNIDALAARSLRFERCFAPVPITLPSHTSMLTGLYPLRHSVRDNGTFRLPEHIPTLATVLGDAGWRTIGVIGAFPLTARFGLARGFDVWDEELIERQQELLPLAFDQRPADRVTRAALRHLERLEREPFFLFVHYFDPHRPWQAPALYGERYRGSPYGAEIAFTDAWVGRLLEGVRAMGLLDRTLVVFTADHGEGLRDHEEETHSYLLYNETVRVPLLLAAPGVGAGVVEHPVSLVDIVPTVLELVGVDTPGSLDGRSLLAPPQPGRLIYLESLAGRLQHGWNDLRACVVGANKFILGIEPQLYDLDHDLAERHNLAADKRHLAEEIDGDLRRFIASNQGPRSLRDAFSVADEDVVRQLEALGYAVAGTRERDWSEPGPITRGGDPRRHIELVDIQSVCRSLLNSGEVPLALEMVEHGLDDHPDDLELLRLLVTARLAAGDGARAVAAAHRLQRVAFPEARDHVLCALAALAAGDLETALGLARRAAAVGGGDRERRLLATVLARVGDHGEAVAVLGAILEDNPCEGATLRELASIQRRAGNRAELEASYRRMRDCAPRDPAPLVNLGNLRVESQDLEAAEALYREAAELHPGYALAHYALGVVHAQRGDAVAAEEALRRALALAPVNSPVGRRASELLRLQEEGHGVVDG